MIIARIRLIAKTDKQQELLQTAESLCLKIAREKGCLDSQVYQSTANPLEIVISEEWENEEAIERHLESDSLAILAGAGSILSSQVEIFTGNDVPTQAIQESLEKKLKKKTSKN